MSRLHPDGSIRDPDNVDRSIAFFRLAFRPFFLLGSAFSILAIILWALVINGNLQLTVYGGGYWWHFHEMFFGFVIAIVCGFLLTAVQTWTGVPSVKGATLIFLVVLWLAGRVVFFLPEQIPAIAIAIIDASFLPLAALLLARPILKAKQWRNIMFVPILLLMALVNISLHKQALNGVFTTSASEVMVLMVSLLMTLIGGRVFPMFTANGTQTPRVAPITTLEMLAIFSVITAVLTVLFNYFEWLNLPTKIQAGILMLAGIANLVRAFRWRIWVTFKTPLVWSLHLSYWAMAIGLIMMGFAKTGELFTSSQAIHAVTVGGMGGMILAMISRVSLGHTGRNIKVGSIMALAFALINLSFTVRVFAPSLFDNYGLIILLAAILWLLAYGIFVIRYAPILSKPRIDGRSG